MGPSVGFLLAVSALIENAIFIMHVCFDELGGGFKYILFSSLFGEDEPILTVRIFFRWGETTNQLRVLD